MLLIQDLIAFAIQQTNEVTSEARKHHASSEELMATFTDTPRLNNALHSRSTSKAISILSQTLNKPKEKQYILNL